MKTSLELFNSLVDSKYTSIKKYIALSRDNQVILEDYENYAWRMNPDLEPLFETPSVLPIKSLDVTYKEKDCMFLIIVNLK